MKDSSGQRDRLFELMGTLCDEDASQGEIAELDSVVFDDQRLDADTSAIAACTVH